jgi:hypothetical protein
MSTAAAEFAAVSDRACNTDKGARQRAMSLIKGEYPISSVGRQGADLVCAIEKK